MLITFSGLDGAGKSTLIAWLKDTLERRNRRVAVFHMIVHVKSSHPAIPSFQGVLEPRDEGGLTRAIQDRKSVV